MKNQSSVPVKSPNKSTKNKNLVSDAELMKVFNSDSFEKRMQLFDLMKVSPIPQEEQLNNIGVFLDRRIISRFLYINELYELILPLHGSIMEFGVRYGQNLSLFTSLRGIHEPYNHNRKIIGFDTFEGFPSIDLKDQDGKTDKKIGDFAVPDKYENFLSQILDVHEEMAPISSIKKNALVKGDASKTIVKYLADHQETIITLAYFDFDLYKPTKDCLEAILPYLSKGAIIAFDEINIAEYPGETAALREVLGTKNQTIRHSKYRANAGYLIYE